MAEDTEEQLQLLQERLGELEQAWGLQQEALAQLEQQLEEMQKRVTELRSLVQLARKEIYSVQTAQRMALKIPIPPTAVVPLGKRSKGLLWIAGVATSLAVVLAATPKTITGRGWVYESGGVDLMGAAALVGAVGSLSGFFVARKNDKKEHQESTTSKEA